MRLHLGGVDAMVSMMAAFRPEPAAAEPLLRLTLREDGFEPPHLLLPAGRGAVLVVHNAGAGPAELVSRALGLAGVLAAGRAAPVRVRPLRPGECAVLDRVDRPGAGVLLVARAA